MKKVYFIPVFMMTLFFSSIVGLTVGHAAPTIVEFELEIDLKDGKKYDIEYEVEGTTFEAKYKEPGKLTLYGKEAKNKFDTFMNQLNISTSATKEQIKEQILSSLNIDQQNVAEFDLEVKFDNGPKIEIEN